jgi:hypothetical protein
MTEPNRTTRRDNGERLCTIRVKDRVHLIECRATGWRVQFLGDLRLKPRGYRVVAFLGPAMTGDGGGLAY